MASFSKIWNKCEVERVFRNNWALVGFHKVVPPETNPGFFYNTPHHSVYYYLLNTYYHKNHPISVIFVCLTQLCILPWSHVDCRTLCIWAIWTAVRVRCTWEWRWWIYWVMWQKRPQALTLTWPVREYFHFFSVQVILDVWCVSWYKWCTGCTRISFVFIFSNSLATITTCQYLVQLLDQHLFPLCHHSFQFCLIWLLGQMFGTSFFWNWFLRCSLLFGLEYLITFGYLRRITCGSENHKS